MTDGTAAGRRRSSRRWWAGAAVVVAVLGALVVLGANRPADPYFLEGAGRPLAGTFRSVSFTIGAPGAEASGAAERCAFLAESAEEQGRGLMNVTDLEGRDGMLFRFAEDVTTGFFMKDTPMPLSIAWFDADGDFVSATNMAPCLDRPSCPTYPPAGPYRYALEVPQGRLPDLGAVPGSRLSVGGPCG